MGEEGGLKSVADGSFGVSRSESKLIEGKKRSGAEFGENSELGQKRVKMRDLESLISSEGFDTHYPKSSENKEANAFFLLAKEDRSRFTEESVTMNSNVAQSGRAGRDTLPVLADASRRPLDLNIVVCAPNSSTVDHGASCANKLSSHGENDINFGTSRSFGWDLNAENVSRSVNQNPFHPYKNLEHLKTRDASECGSTTGPSQEKDSMRLWKEMKQNGFMSSSHGGIPVPKQRGRKTKNDGLKKKMELAKREQIDRFAKIAAPSGLLNDLNPGIINHVRNSKQVHSIIEALVRSEKLDNRQNGSKQGIQMKSGTKDIGERKKDLEYINGSGMNRLDLSYDDESMYTSLESQQTRGCSIPMCESENMISERRWADGDPSMVDRTVFGHTLFPSHSNPGTERDILALKLSSSTTMASEITSSLSNEESGNLTSVSSLSVKAANVASQWLELLFQDIKGRLAALRRSKKRVRAVINTELPFLMSREFSSNQENDPCLVKISAGCSDIANADMHRARWSALFDQMDKTLSEEEKQLESWMNQVKEMHLHCERGLQQFHNATNGLKQLGTLDNLSKSVDNVEREMAVRAAAASIYSTCNFVLSMENLPSF